VPPVAPFEDTPRIEWSNVIVVGISWLESALGLLFGQGSPAMPAPSMATSHKPQTSARRTVER
jgi:hypothetical protein